VAEFEAKSVAVIESPDKVAGVVAEEISDTTETTISGKRIEVVAIDDLNIDADYQREFKRKRAEDIGEHWDDRRAGQIRVSRREDDSMWVIDGQHRTRGAQHAGNTHIVAEIDEGLDQAEEARLFDQLNQGRAPVSALERFRARLVYRDPEALEMTRIVQEFEGTIAEKTGRKNQDDTGIRSIHSLERIYQAEGAAGLREILSLINDAWGVVDYQTTNEYTLGGLRQFMIRQNGKYDRVHLVERLKSEGHEQIRRMAHAHGQIFGGSAPMNWYRACVEAYNKHLTPRHRLRPR
jgi:hypothetical protein